MRPALFVVVLAASLLAFFPTLWSPSSIDNGCGWDPNGCPGNAMPDNGCGMDPDGCPGGAMPDNGCIMDPSGCPRGE